jgi:hypothetical protein
MSSASLHGGDIIDKGVEQGIDAVHFGICVPQTIGGLGFTTFLLMDKTLLLVAERSRVCAAPQ